MPELRKAAILQTEDQSSFSPQMRTEPLHTSKSEENRGGVAVWPSEDLQYIDRCPLCASRQRRLLHDGLVDQVYFCAPGVWSLHRCDRCRCAYLDPRPTLASIGRAYNSYYTHGPDDIASTPKGRLGLLKQSMYNSFLNSRYGFRLKPALWLGRFVVPLMPRHVAQLDRRVRHLALPAAGARIMDIGCGAGSFVRYASTLGWDAEGVDPDPVAAKFARDGGLKVRVGGIPGLDAPDCCFAAVTMSHVIEHLHDPIAALRDVFRVLSRADPFGSPRRISVRSPTGFSVDIGLDSRARAISSSSLRRRCETR